MTLGVPAAETLSSAVLHTGLVTSEQIELSAFFLIGLLGGAHCLGMCGPLVTMYAKQFGERATSSPERSGVTFRELRQHLLFNSGRTVSYAALGGLFGLAGAFVFDAASIVLVFSGAVRATVGLVIGLLIVGTGRRYVSGRRGSHGSSIELPLAG
jgi:sulfite exporter TauE/SafE